MSRQVLLVDDDQAVREALAQTLELGGFLPVLAASFIEAKDHISARFDGIVISDIRMPGKDGFALLDYAKQADEALPVILLTGEGDVPTAVRGISQGAFDFLEKPCDPKRLIDVAERALNTRTLVMENRRLKNDLDRALHEKIGFLGVSEHSRQIREAIRRAGRVQSPVLISGDRGSGRGHVARLIHELRPQSGELRRVDCASPFDLTALQTLGEGVLLCDIERLDPVDQTRVLNALASSENQAVFVTTHNLIEDSVHKGQFSDDLYYHLAVMRIAVPPLRERREDIPVLFNKFLREEIDAGALVTSQTGQAAKQGLASLDWSGDLRSLRNHAKRVAWGLDDETTEIGLKPQLERVERGIIEDSLRRHKGHASDAARTLGLPRKTFYDRLQKLGIRAEDFRD